MRDPWDDVELRRRFLSQAETALPRAPLNSALCSIIARDRGLYGLLAHAPETQRQPVLLLAAIHFLLLDDPDQPLARWYPNLVADSRSPDEGALAAELTEFVAERAPMIADIVSSRRVQTNEVGRSALLLPPLALVGDETGPLAMIDIGASAGFNLLIPAFCYRYGDGPLLGPPSGVMIRCDLRGDGPVPTAIPDFAARCGIDTRPVDVTDPVEARWLEACCWPDQADRFHRLRAAIEIARARPPELLAGDAVESLAMAVERMADRGHPVVTTSWVLNYLPPDRRRAFVDELDGLGARFDLTWVFAESPAQTPELPHAADLEAEQLTALSVASWRAGRRTLRHLATCHPHGYWLHWR